MLEKYEVPTKSQVAAAKKIKDAEARVVRENKIADMAKRFSHELRSELRDGNTTFEINRDFEDGEDWEAYWKKASEEFVAAGWRVVVKASRFRFHVEMTQPRFLKPKFCSR